MSLPGRAVDLAEVQRRTIRTLVVVQAVGALGITIGIATASLLARDISGSESQAGFAQTAQVLGTAFAAYLLARLMSRRGRRIGLVTGYLLGAGRGRARGGRRRRRLDGAAARRRPAARVDHRRQQQRAVRRDRPAEDAHKGRALSTVVWATTIGAVIGPNLTGPAGALADLLGIPELTGPSRSAPSAWSWPRVVVGVLLRPDPLLLAREVAGVAETPPDRHRLGAARSPPVRERPVLALRDARAWPCAHAAMVGVMIMTPLHMEHGHAELEVIGLVISLHVLGMFAFSPVVGLLADRFGRPTTLVAGAVLLLAAMVLCARSPEGSSWQIFAGLFLLGLGWSFATVSASTLIAQHAPLEARTDVQGATDLVMGLTAAAAGGLAGLVVGALGLPRARGLRRSAWSRWSRSPALGARATTRLPATDRVTSMSIADVAVIGGTGFYSFLDDYEEHAVETPYGAPSAPIAVGTVAGRRVAFLPAARAAPRVPAARDPVPRQPLGAALPRRTPGARAVRRRRPARRGRARRRRRARPARRPDPPADLVVRRDRRRAPALRRPLLRPAVGGGHRRRPGHQVRGSDGGHRGPALLHPRRVAALRRAGLDADQHDRRTPRRCSPGRCGCATPRSRW